VGGSRQRCQSYLFPFADHHRAGSQIAQPLRPIVEEHDYDADAVINRQEIYRPHQVTDGRIHKGDGSATVFDDPQTHPTLARRLAIPDHFKEEIIAPQQGERQQRQPGGDPGAGLVALLIITDPCQHHPHHPQDQHLEEEDQE